jgi:hypothetical protein
MAAALAILMSSIAHSALAGSSASCSFRHGNGSLLRDIGVVASVVSALLSGINMMY